MANSFPSLGRAGGPLWAGFVDYFNTALPFWSGALIQLIGLLISLKVWSAQAERPPAAAPTSPTPH